MDSFRTRIIEALEGRAPDVTPYSFYRWMIGDGVNTPEWQQLLERGLGMTEHFRTVRHIEHGVEDSVEDKHDGNKHYRIYRKKTPVGTLQNVTLNGWHHEDWIKEPEDYDIRRWIVEHTELVPNYDGFAEAEEMMGDQGITIVTGSRTPAMSINVDWAGTEQFCMDVASDVDELYALYEAQKKQFLEETRLIAAGPGRYIKWFENLTINMLGPKRYEDLLLNVYEEAVPLLNAAGKRVMVHYDGDLNCIRDQIARAPFHMIESLTEPPEGDMTYDQCRAAWPDKVFWGNINVDLYSKSPDVLAQAVREKRIRAGKEGLAFEISEDMPANWQDVIPVVLDTLEEME